MNAIVDQYFNQSNASQPVNQSLVENMTPFVEIYTKSWCPYCHKAKALLQAKGISYDEVDVTTEPLLEHEMRIRSHQRTVPQIFIGDIHVGGADDLHRLEETGELDDLLAQETFKRDRGLDKPQNVYRYRPDDNIAQSFVLKPAPVAYAPDYRRESKISKSLKVIARGLSFTGLAALLYSAVLIGLFIQSAIIEF